MGAGADFLRFITNWGSSGMNLKYGVTTGSSCLMWTISAEWSHAVNQSATTVQYVPKSLKCSFYVASFPGFLPGFVLLLGTRLHSRPPLSWAMTKKSNSMKKWLQTRNSVCTEPGCHFHWAETPFQLSDLWQSVTSLVPTLPFHNSPSSFAFLYKLVRDSHSASESAPLCRTGFSTALCCDTPTPTDPPPRWVPPRPESQ